MAPTPATLALGEDTFALAREAGTQTRRPATGRPFALVRHGPLEALFDVCVAMRPGIALHRHEEPTEG
jgi:hypothetical protein